MGDFLREPVLPTEEGAAAVAPLAVLRNVRSVVVAGPDKQ